MQVSESFIAKGQISYESITSRKVILLMLKRSIQVFSKKIKKASLTALISSFATPPC
jgi:hypothetical protein